MTAAEVEKLRCPSCGSKDIIVIPSNGRTWCLERRCGRYWARHPEWTP